MTVAGAHGVDAGAQRIRLTTGGGRARTWLADAQLSQVGVRAGLTLGPITFAVPSPFRAGAAFLTRRTVIAGCLGLLSLALTLPLAATTAAASRATGAVASWPLLGPAGFTFAL